MNLESVLETLLFIYNELMSLVYSPSYYCYIRYCSFFNCMRFFNFYSKFFYEHSCKSSSQMCFYRNIKQSLIY